MDIYDRIDECLNKHRLTKTDMCKHINLSYNTLMSCYRRRSKKIPLETIRDISKYLGCTLDYLITGLTDESVNINNEGNNKSIINNISNNNVHTVTVSNGVDKKWNLTEIEYEVLNIMSKLSIKARSELLNEAYRIEKNNKQRED